MRENRCSTPRIALLALLGGMVFLFETSKAKTAEDAATPAQIFERRIVPIFKSPNPSSCAQCHLAAVDLKNYILPSHEKSFLSLRDQGLIDLDNPERSKILHLIQMGAKDDNKGAPSSAPRYGRRSTRRSPPGSSRAAPTPACATPRSWRRTSAPPRRAPSKSSVTPARIGSCNRSRTTSGRCASAA
jgi:hypothetical protein